MNLLKTIYSSSSIIVIKVCYLKSCVTGRLYLMPCRIVSEYSSTIRCTFAINSVIVVAISCNLSARYLKSNESSGGISGCNGPILLKIHSCPCSQTSTKHINMLGLGQ